MTKTLMVTATITITIATIRIVKLTVLQRYGPAAAFDTSFQAKMPLLGSWSGGKASHLWKQKLLNYIYSAIYFFNKEIMLQQSICSWLPIVKTSHSTIPYDHLQKESKRGADSFGVVVVCFHVNVVIRVVLCIATVLLHVYDIICYSHH